LNITANQSNLQRAVSYGLQVDHCDGRRRGEGSGIWRQETRAPSGIIEARFPVSVSVPTGRDSSVGIATRYGLDGPGSKPGGGKINLNCPDRPWGPPSLLYKGYRVFAGSKAAGAWR